MKPRAHVVLCLGTWWRASRAIIENTWKMFSSCCTRKEKGEGNVIEMYERSWGLAFFFFSKAVQKFMIFVHLNMHSHNVCA